MYGLPDSWIARLGEPDKLVPNPHYRSRTASLYLRMRVEQFLDDNKQEYLAWLEQRKKLSARMEQVAKKRAASLIEWAISVPLRWTAKLPKNYQALERLVEDAFYAFQYERGRYDADFSPSRNAIIAHLRHATTNYEQLLGELSGKPGSVEAYLIIKERANIFVQSRLIDKYEKES